MAVAVKSRGFTNIKIYNGGLKDWLKSGRDVESIELLPEVEVPLITADELQQRIMKAEEAGCVDSKGEPLLTLVDLRSSLYLKEKIGADHRVIQTQCETVTSILDNFITDRLLLARIPKNGVVVTVSETGNRDEFLIRYLSKHDYSNIVGLKFGMRGWLTSRFPTKKTSPDK